MPVDWNTATPASYKVASSPIPSNVTLAAPLTPIAYADDTSLQASPLNVTLPIIRIATGWQLFLALIACVIAATPVYSVLPIFILTVFLLASVT